MCCTVSRDEQHRIQAVPLGLWLGESGDVAWKVADLSTVNARARSSRTGARERDQLDNRSSKHANLQKIKSSGIKAGRVGRDVRDECSAGGGGAKPPAPLLRPRHRDG
jgi:hypothetical protein